MPKPLPKRAPVEEPAPAPVIDPVSESVFAQLAAITKHMERLCDLLEAAHPQIYTLEPLAARLGILKSAATRLLAGREFLTADEVREYEAKKAADRG